MKFQTTRMTVVCLLLLIFFPNAHVDAEESGAFPRAMIEQTSVEFSPVIAGVDVTQVFYIQNKGDAPLNIPGIYTD